MKVSYITRDIKLSPELDTIFKAEILQENDQTKTAPGQIRQKGEWYYLTYLRTVKVKNFSPISWDLIEQDYDSIRVAIFKIYSGKLIINGSKTDINEIDTYFQALSLKLVTGIVGTEHFALTSPTVDLLNIIQAQQLTY